MDFGKFHFCKIEIDGVALTIAVNVLVEQTCL